MCWHFCFYVPTIFTIYFYGAHVQVASMDSMGTLYFRPDIDPLDIALAFKNHVFVSFREVKSFLFLRTLSPCNWISNPSINLLLNKFSSKRRILGIYFILKKSMLWFKLFIRTVIIVSKRWLFLICFYVEVRFYVAQILACFACVNKYTICTFCLMN